MQPRIDYPDYTLWLDPETGAWRGIRRSTQEEIDIDVTISPAGSRICTPADIEAANERKAQKRKFLMQKERLDKLGKFYFLAIENGFSEINAATAARLVYLSTFLRYGTNNLYLTKRTKMKKADLPEVMGMSSTTAFRFFKEVNPTYLQVDEEGYISLSGQIFRRGTLGKDNKSKAYQKIYIEAVRKLYNGTPLSNHKELGYIFAMLPYINIEYNVLCKNPYETDISEIELITIREFCEAIGHSFSTVARLLETYSKICFCVDGAVEHFCKFVLAGNDINHASVFVNPHVIYSGTDPEQVKVLSALAKSTQQSLSTNLKSDFYGF